MGRQIVYHAAVIGIMVIGLSLVSSSTLAKQEPGGPAVIHAQAGGIIQLGQNQFGCISDAAPYQTWTLNNMQAGDYVSIFMSSYDASLDPYVYLLTSSYQLITSNDDYSGLDAAIVNFPLPYAGSYIIQASSFGRTSGPYALTVVRGNQTSVSLPPLTTNPCNTALGISAITTAPTLPPTGSLRLGALEVAPYCTDRGYGITLVNANRDWACTLNNQLAFILGLADFNAICRDVYRNPSAFAILDGNNTTIAYNWSCFAPSGSTIAPPTSTMRLGDFSVEWYCTARGYQTALVNSNRDWACTQNNSPVFTLGQTDFNAICRATYNDTNAFAILDGNNAIIAYNWSCYTSVVTPPTVNVRLGEFAVEWYCEEKGYGTMLVNNNHDWACTQNNNVVFILAQTDLDAICHAWYNNPFSFAVLDQNKPIVAHNYSCYAPQSSLQQFPTPTATQAQGTSLGPVLGSLSPNDNVELNVRAGPGTDYQKLGTIYWTESYPYLGQDGAWYIIDYNGQRGYVHSRWAHIN